MRFSHLIKYDIVFIRGNKEQGTAEMHNFIENQVLSHLKDFSIKKVESDNKDLILPKAKVYIGFSRGTRYLRQFKNRKDVLTICLGGNACGENNFINNGDRTFKKDLSDESLNAHFKINDKHLKQIIRKIKVFLS